MPYKAMVEGTLVCSLDIERGEWNRLRARRPAVEMVCCKKRGHLVTSRRGTQFFRHERRSGCDWAPETEAHRECKRIIYEAARSLGYEADVEAEGDGWRADVLVQAEEHKYAFEVQLSAQSLDETIRRTRKLVQSGVIPVWLMRPMLYRSTKPQVPVFCVLCGDEQPPAVRRADGEEIPLEEFVKEVLHGVVPLEGLTLGLFSRDSDEPEVGFPWGSVVMLGAIALWFGAALLDAYREQAEVAKRKRRGKPSRGPGAA